MAASVLFLVHGIGRQGADWATREDGVTATLHRQAQRFSRYRNGDLADDVELVPLRYDDLFDRILAHWRQQGRSLLAGLQGIESVVPDAVTQVGEQLAALDGDENAFLASGGDVVLYYAFPLFRRRVLLRVVSQLAEAIAARTAGESNRQRDFSVLAHSMGTSVAHDALHLLGDTAWLRDAQAQRAGTGGPEAGEDGTDDAGRLRAAVGGSGASGFEPDRFRFRAVMMLANTSELLHTTVSPYASIVRPIAEGGHVAYCEAYLDLNHRFDPIPRVRPFRMPATWHGAGGQEWNDLAFYYGGGIHDFTHYLSSPNVCTRILYAAVQDFAPTAEEWRDATESPEPELPEVLRNRLEGWANRVRGSAPVEGVLESVRALREAH